MVSNLTCEHSIAAKCCLVIWETKLIGNWNQGKDEIYTNRPYLTDLLEGKSKRLSFLWSIFTNIPLQLSCTTDSSAREHSPLGEVSLYGWSPVLQVWIQLLRYTQITTYFFLIISNLIQMDTSCTVILPPTVSVLWLSHPWISTCSYRLL